jgi:hypothetical protein
MSYTQARDELKDAILDAIVDAIQAGCHQIIEDDNWSVERMFGARMARDAAIAAVRAMEFPPDAPAEERIAEQPVQHLHGHRATARCETVPRARIRELEEFEAAVEMYCDGEIILSCNREGHWSRLRGSSSEIPALRGPFKTRKEAIFAAYRSAGAKTEEAE